MTSGVGADPSSLLRVPRPGFFNPPLSSQIWLLPPLTANVKKMKSFSNLPSLLFFVAPFVQSCVPIFFPRDSTHFLKCFILLLIVLGTEQQDLAALVSKKKEKEKAASRVPSTDLLYAHPAGQCHQTTSRPDQAQYLCLGHCVHTKHTRAHSTLFS